MTTGYSETPLAKKLGIKANDVVAIHDEPAELRSLLADLPEGVVFRERVDGAADVVMMFVTDRVEFETRVPAAAEAIFPAGAIWVAWPKRASDVPTDMNGNVVREIALPMGLVDNKVCAINDVWSGLRVVWRKENRQRASGA